MQIARLAQLDSFTTLDGSGIRELASGHGRMRLGAEENEVAAGDDTVMTGG